MRENKQGQRTIIGTILPAELDENNNVTDIGIETEDSEEYIVFMDRKGEETSYKIERHSPVLNVNDYNLPLTSQMI